MCLYNIRHGALFFISLDDAHLRRIQTYLHTPEIQIRGLGWRAWRDENEKHEQVTLIKLKNKPLYAHILVELFDVSTLLVMVGK